FLAVEPGGRIRLTTPDVGRTARIYLDDQELGDRHLERHRQAGYHDVAHRVDLLRITFSREVGHHLGYMWDLEALTVELEQAGFVNVHRCELSESADQHFIGVESRVSDTVAATALVVEAEKTSERRTTPLVG